MSEIIIEIKIKVNGLLSGNGLHPHEMAFQYRYHAGDNQRTFEDEVRKATVAAIQKAGLIPKLS